ncbi:MAG: hypothetical protein FJ288_12190 [Planctomycetes bacterium]|nr:hypothetical protein [Planctomycetota bacterium]
MKTINTISLGLISLLFSVTSLPAADSPVTPQERKNLCERAIKAGWLKGVRAVELIRADIISVTIDAGITAAIAPTMYRLDAAVGRHTDVLAPYAKPDAFTIASPTDPDYKTPVPRPTSASAPMRAATPSILARRCPVARSSTPTASCSCPSR